MTDYERADFALLRETGYGVGFHWTTATVPPMGEPAAHDEAIKAFDVAAFVQHVKQTGAGHVLFTATHSKHHFCGPNPEIDKVLPGRTCERDLLMELADALNDTDILLIMYYNSGIHRNDPEWRHAVGAEDKASPKFFEHWTRIVGWIGEHYGPKISAFWFDGGYELDSFEHTPWEDLTAAAKAGHPDRLICYNPGIEKHFLYTPDQDFWAGEVCRVNFIPRGELTPSGLPWYAFLSWHGDSRKPNCGHWVMNRENCEHPWRPPSPETAVNFLRGFQNVGGTVTFNVFCYQDGSIYPPDFELMKGVRRLTR